MEIPGMKPLKDMQQRHQEAKRLEVQERVENAVSDIVNQPPSDTDPQGSYTGKPENPNERPVQDADDL